MTRTIRGVRAPALRWCAAIRNSSVRSPTPWTSSIGIHRRSLPGRRRTIQPGEEINDVLDDFERLSWAGLEPDRYAWSAVRHDEPDGGVHVHILAARVDLETGKSLNIAPPGWHRDFYPWRDYHNLKHNWARPDDPARARVVQPGHQALIVADRLKDGLPAATNPKADITDYLTQQINLGLINCRDAIVQSLQEIGQVTRAGKDYVSVKPEGFDRAIRLRGAIYDKQFTADTYRQTPSEMIEDRKALEQVVETQLRMFKQNTQKQFDDVNASIEANMAELKRKVYLYQPKPWIFLLAFSLLFFLFLTTGAYGTNKYLDITIRQKLETLEKHNQALKALGDVKIEHRVQEDGLYLIMPNNKEPRVYQVEQLPNVGSSR